MMRAMRVRKLSVDDADACVACAQTVGWAAPRDAWTWMLELGDAYGIDAKGELGGAVIVFPFGDVFAMVAMMMVRADVQRQGLGQAVLRHAREALPRSTAMALYSSDVGERLYRPLGFRDDGQSSRWEGLVAPTSPREPPPPGLRELRADDVDALIALDARAQGAPRPRLVRSLLVRRAAGWVVERAGRIDGFGLALREQEALRLGPIVAPRDDDAIAIADALAPSSGVIRLDLEPGEDVLLGWAEGRRLEAGVLSPRLVAGLDRLPGERRASRSLAGRAFG